MASLAFPVVWRDANRHSLNGVVEIQSSDFPNGKVDIARVRDLMAILNKKIAELTPAKSVVREVNRIMLHGVRASSNSSLEYLVPELMSSSPRFVATTQARPVIPQSPMVIFFHTHGGASAQIECMPSDTVAYIKACFEAKEGMPCENQRLTFAGKQLQDKRTLSSYSIGNYSSLYLTGRLVGGEVGGLTRTFADVSDGSIITAHEFSDRAPEWRICSKGLNIEGRCENRECPAFRHMAIHRKKFELFNLTRDNNVRCPLCQWRMKPITCGLYDCLWRFEGTKVSDGMSLSSRWADAQGYKYHRFNADENNNFVEWTNMVMMVKPRNEPTVVMLLQLSDSVAVKTDDVCTVCWSTFGSTSKRAIATTHCGHNFHGVCIDTWSDRCKKNDVLPSCPICRRTA